MPAMPPPFRSSFVSVLGWIFVCLAGFTTLISLLQNVMLMFLPNMQQQMAAQSMPPEMPASMSWLFGHMIWFFRFVLLVSATTLVAAIGLLRRRNWARLLFIGLMGFAIAYQLLGVAFQWWFMGSMQQMMQLPSAAPAHVADGIHGFIVAIQVFSAVMAIAFITLFGWIIRRLCSQSIRHEFGQPAPPPRPMEKFP